MDFSRKSNEMNSYNSKQRKLMNHHLRHYDSYSSASNSSSDYFKLTALLLQIRRKTLKRPLTSKFRTLIKKWRMQVQVIVYDNDCFSLSDNRKYQYSYFCQSSDVFEHCLKGCAIMVHSNTCLSLSRENFNQVLKYLGSLITMQSTEGLTDMQESKNLVTRCILEW